MYSLADRYDARHNGLWALRLVLAITVAVVHAQVIGWQSQPRLGRTDLGDLAVDGFFVISGFLVTSSAERLSLSRFAWHRALRILPGYWVSLVVTAFVAAPLLAWARGRPPSGVLSGAGSAPDFVVANVALMIRQWTIAGLPGPPLVDDAMNGSLWTLFYEALCYLAIAALAWAGMIRKGKGGHRLLAHPLVATTAAVWVCLTAQSLGWLGGRLEYLPRFALLFLLGALGRRYAHRVRYSTVGLVAAVMVLAVGVGVFENYRPLSGGAFAYLVLWLMVALPVTVQPSIDLSYGLYVYHWPVQLLTVETGLRDGGRVVLTVASIAATLVAALASWFLVEQPALRHKQLSWEPRWLRGWLGARYRSGARPPASE